MILTREARKDASASLSTDTRNPEGRFWQAICVGKGETEEDLDMSLSLGEGRALAE